MCYVRIHILFRKFKFTPCVAPEKQWSSQVGGDHVFEINDYSLSTKSVAKNLILSIFQANKHVEVESAANF